MLYLSCVMHVGNPGTRLSVVSGLQAITLFVSGLQAITLFVSGLQAITLFVSGLQAITLCGN